MICPVCGAAALVSRDQMTGRVGVAQCQSCSHVLEASGWVPRRCVQCGLAWGESLHDPCLGQLPGIGQACCGHGDPAAAYQTAV